MPHDVVLSSSVTGYRVSRLSSFVETVVNHSLLTTVHAVSCKQYPTSCLHDCADIVHTARMEKQQHNECLQQPLLVACAFTVKQGSVEI